MKSFNIFRIKIPNILIQQSPFHEQDTLAFISLSLHLLLLRKGASSPSDLLVNSQMTSELTWVMALVDATQF